MLYTNAVFKRKDTEVEATGCVVDKVIRLPGSEFDRFSHGLMRDWDFIRDNPIDTVVDKEGRRHCLLVVGDDRRDGILVNAEGGNYARYSAFIPNVEGLLTVGQYPALAELNKKLIDVIDHIADQIGKDAYIDINGRLRSTMDIESMEAEFDIELTGTLLDTVYSMLDQKPEIEDWELDNNEIIIYSEPEQPEDLSDPSVTKTDMYAYGYEWEGMIPLGRERALELFDNELEVYLLYQDGTEAAAENREDILAHDGFFGIGNPAVEIMPQYESIEVFILNREQYEKGEASGEWLTLPADADTLRGLFERIGIDRPSDGAFTITAVRVPQEYLRDHVTKYDSLDELNMLALYMKDMEGFELNKFQAILTNRIVDVGKGTAALINLLGSDNFDSFNMIDAHDAEALGRYYAAENDEKPDGVGFEQYGYQCVKEENGVFTKWGYLYSRYGEVSPEYTGVVPDEYKIVGEALRGLRSKTQERGSQDDKPSVVAQIKAARQAPRQPHKPKTERDKKSQEPEL